jgi:hypothetical protein
MNIPDWSGVRQLMSKRVRLTPDYSIEISLCERDGFHFVLCEWHPTRPSWAEVEALEQKVAAAKAPYLRKAMQLGGLRLVGAA